MADEREAADLTSTGGAKAASHHPQLGSGEASRAEVERGEEPRADPLAEVHPSRPGTPRTQTFDGQTAQRVMRTGELFRLLRYIVVTAGVVLGILAVAVPLQVFTTIADALAGRTTTVNGVINISVAISISFALALTGAGFKMRSQSKELKRLRERVSAYERELAARNAVTEREARS